jgi:hypothetical protein
MEKFALPPSDFDTSCLNNDKKSVSYYRFLVLMTSI